MTDDEKVTMLLARAGLDVPEADRAYFTNTYPLVRMMADMLYAVDAANDESPGVVFDPAPRFDDWG